MYGHVHVPEGLQNHFRRESRALNRMIQLLGLPSSSIVCVFEAGLMHMFSSFPGLVHLLHDFRNDECSMLHIGKCLFFRCYFAFGGGEVSSSSEIVMLVLLVIRLR